MILMKGQATESGKDQVLIQELGQVTIIEPNILKINNLCYNINGNLCSMWDCIFDFRMLRRQ